MEWMWIIIALPVIALIGGAMTNAMKTNAFAGMGDITGKTLDEIKSHVGEPSSISAAPDGTLYQWMGINGGSSYHYAILFDLEGKAVGYTHQHVS
nr:hypothetical protein [Brevundimonas diminuta]